MWGEEEEEVERSGTESSSSFSEGCGGDDDDDAGSDDVGLSVPNARRTSRTRTTVARDGTLKRSAPWAGTHPSSLASAASTSTSAIRRQISDHAETAVHEINVKIAGNPTRRSAGGIPLESAHQPLVFTSRRAAEGFGARHAETQPSEVCSDVTKAAPELLKVR